MTHSSYLFRTKPEQRGDDRSCNAAEKKELGKEAEALLPMRHTHAPKGMGAGDKIDVRIHGSISRASERWRSNAARASAAIVSSDFFVPSAAWRA